MKKDLNFNLNLKTLLPRLKDLQKRLAGHALFIVVIVTLLAYVFVVFKINGLATAEPSTDQESANVASGKVPTIDRNAIQQVQALEQNNTSVHTLFQNARNNPFQE